MESNLKNNIGLLVWGTKRGEQNFFNSDNLDLDLELNTESLKDIRAYIGCNKTLVKFFSISFSKNYRINTGYLTLIDQTNRNGYLAISLFVPHNLKSEEGEKKILDKLIELYQKVNIDSDSGRILSIREKPDLFYQIINESIFETSVHNSPSITSSKKDFAQVICTESSDIDNFNNDPYRPEFYDYHQVLFLEEKILDEIYYSSSIPVLTSKPVVDYYDLELEIKDENNELVTDSCKVENLQLKGLRSDAVLTGTITKAHYEDIVVTDSLQKLETHPDKEKTKIFRATLKLKTYRVEVKLVDRYDNSINKASVECKGRSLSINDGIVIIETTHNKDNKVKIKWEESHEFIEVKIKDKELLNEKKTITNRSFINSKKGGNSGMTSGAKEGNSKLIPKGGKYKTIKAIFISLAIIGVFVMSYLFLISESPKERFDEMDSRIKKEIEAQEISKIKLGAYDSINNEFNKEYKELKSNLKKGDEIYKSCDNRINEINNWNRFDKKSIIDLKKYKNSKHKLYLEKSNELINILDNEAWSNINEKNDTTQLNNYIENFSEHKVEAEELLKNLRKKKVQKPSKSVESSQKKLESTKTEDTKKEGNPIDLIIPD